MANDILASSLSGSRFNQFDQTWAGRLDNIDIGVALVSIIDTVPADALPFLAEELNVTGLKGWDFCTTEQERRELLKNAIELHRYKGTPFGIIRAVQSIGFRDAVVQERVGLVYDGTATYNGTFNHGAGSWATFRVVFDLGNQKGITAELGQALKFLIKEYKPASRTLVGVSFTANLQDSLTDDPEEELTLSASLDDVLKDTFQTNGLTYDGSAVYDGTSRHSGSTDVLTINVGMQMSEGLPQLPVQHQGLLRYNGSRNYDGLGTIPPGDAGMVITITSPSGEVQILSA